MNQLESEFMETLIKGLLDTARLSNSTPTKVVLGSDFPMTENMSVEGVPCVLSHSQPDNQIRIVNHEIGNEVELLVVNFQQSPLIPDRLTEHFKDAGLLPDA